MNSESQTTIVVGPFPNPKMPSIDANGLMVPPGIPMPEFRLLLCFVLFFAAGCGGKSYEETQFEFLNSSDTKIWVDNLGPLKYPPPCGVLGPNITANSGMPTQPIPNELVIKWWYVNEDADDKNVVETKVKVSGGETSKIMSHVKLIFSDGNWTARFATAN